MAFKKHNWLNYGRSGMTAELKILDENNRRIDFFRWSPSDKKSERNVVSLLKRKYDIGFFLKNK